MGQPLLRNPLFLLAFAMSSLFVGAAFVYMSTKSPFFWGDMFLPGSPFLLVFAMTAILAIVSVLRAPVAGAASPSAGPSCHAWSLALGGDVREAAGSPFSQNRQRGSRAVPSSWWVSAGLRRGRGRDEMLEMYLHMVSTPAGSPAASMVVV